MAELIIGTLAGVLCTISFIPQIIKTFKTKNTENISMATFLMFSAGVLLWLTYGILIDKLPVILANAITLVFVIMIIAMKIRYGRKRDIREP